MPPVEPVVHLPQVALTPTLDGVTTVLTAFLFVCLAVPGLAKQKAQFYVAMAALLGVIACHTVSLVFATSATAVTGLSVAIGALQLLAFLMLVLSVGGLTAKQLAGDLANAYEVIRRGETKKEVIIPIGDQGRPGGPKVYRVDEDDDAT